MNRHNRSTSTAFREDVLAFLSEDERRSLASASAQPFAAGDQFLDLGRLDEGVRNATGSESVIAGLLPRSAVQDATWEKVLKFLETMRSRGGAGRAVDTFQ